MKIALVAPIEETIPPLKYGATEWIVYYLAHGLGKKGHEVDIYASGNSRNDPVYKVISIQEKNLRSNTTYLEKPQLRESAKLLSLAQAAEYISQKKYDIIHNHVRWRFLLFSPFLQGKIITTNHMPLSLEDQQLIYRHYKHLPHIALSENQKKDMPDLNYLATIYNGIDINKINFNAGAESSHMMFLGRIDDNKGAIEAAKIAQKLKKVVKFFAKIEKTHQPYVEEFKKLIDNKYVQFIGEVTHDEALEELGKARALIMPVKYEDPCPLVPLEAMAAGTPVITFARGALPEEVVDGKTGYIVNQSEQFNRGNWIIKQYGQEGLSEAIEKIYSLSNEDYSKLRQQCRDHIEKNFTVERMVNQYEQLFIKYLSM